MNSQRTIFIIDDDASVCKSIARLLASHGYETEMFLSSETYLAREPYEGIGCIILDLELYGINGLELQEQLLQKKSSLPIIFISGHGSISISVKALRSGALTFLEKPLPEKGLLQALEEAMIISQKRVHDLSRQHETRILFDALTAREMEVFNLVITGMLNKQIAGELKIAEHTVKLHRQHITEKLGVKSVPEIVRLGHDAGLI